MKALDLAAVIGDLVNGLKVLHGISGIANAGIEAIEHLKAAHHEEQQNKIAEGTSRVAADAEFQKKAPES